MNKICIVGGGIAGLSSAYYLIKKGYSGYNIIVLESYNRFGGKIVSVPVTLDNITFMYEGGAGRIANTNLDILRLIDELRLTNNLYPIDNTWDFNKNSKTYKNCMKKTSTELGYCLKEPFSSMTFYDILQTIFSISKGYKGLHYLTFGSFIQNELGTDVLRFMKDIFGYDSEFEELNAIDALELFKKDFNYNIEYYVMNGGLSQITNALVKNLKKAGVKLLLNKKVTSIDKKKNLVTFVNNNKETKLNYKSIILAIPKKSLQTLKGIDGIDNLLDSTQNISLHRVYAVFKDSTWLQKVDKITTDSWIRQIIPVDKEKGLIMISYSDGYYSELLDQYNTLGIMQEQIMKEIRKLLNMDIPNPIWMIGEYWSSGVHFWKSGIKSSEISKKILKPYDNHDIYIVGECYSNNQGWIEGAIQTVNSCLKKYF